MFEYWQVIAGLVSASLLMLGFVWVAKKRSAWRRTRRRQVEASRRQEVKTIPIDIVPPIGTLIEIGRRITELNLEEEKKEKDKKMKKEHWSFHVGDRIYFVPIRGKGRHVLRFARIEKCCPRRNFVVLRWKDSDGNRQHRTRLTPKMLARRQFIPS